MRRLAFLDYGTKVVDTVTGYCGIVTAAAHYYDKCPNRYYIEGIDSTGRPCGDWFDAERLELEEEVNNDSPK